jgi:hypothetical protein
MGAPKFAKSAKDSYDTDLADVAYKLGFCDPATVSPRAAAVLFSKHLIEKWKAYWSEAPEYMQAIGKECRFVDFDFVQPVSGRIRGGCGYCDGNNSGFQGLAADGAKLAVWWLALLCYVPPEHSVGILLEQLDRMGNDVDPTSRQQIVRGVVEWATALYGVRPVLFVHDEEICEGPEATAHRWAPAQAAVMVAAMGLHTPDVKITAEPALMRRWYKAAEAVYAGGVLVPWEPWSEDAEPVRHVGGYKAKIYRDDEGFLLALDFGDHKVLRERLAAERMKDAVKLAETRLWAAIRAFEA